MSENKAIEEAISVLANNMRLYVEAHIRFAGLFKVDREEAINNLDRAFEAKLEAFHTLYDVSKSIFPYFEHGDTNLLVAVRNAIHHRNHPLFRSLYSRLFLDDAPSRWQGAAFLLATHPALHSEPIRMKHFIRLDDLDARLDPTMASPYLDGFIKNRVEQRFMLIDSQLALPLIRQKGLKDRYPKNQIYLDLMPIFTSSVCRVFKAMESAGIDFKGYDADTYRRPFTSEIGVDLRNPTFTMWRYEGWWRDSSHRS